MKNSARLLASFTFLTSAFTATAAQPDSIDALYDDVMEFQSDYIEAIQNAADEGSFADGLKTKPLIKTIQGACETIFEIAQNKAQFLKGCLNAVANADEDFKIVGVFDKERFDGLTLRYRNLTGSGTPEVSQSFSFDKNKDIIDKGCPGSFKSFENVTSPGCVAAQTKVMIDVAQRYERQNRVTEKFKQFCTGRALTVEINKPEHRYGPWYNELEDIRNCIIFMDQSAVETKATIDKDTLESFQLIDSLRRNYENLYEVKWPKEWKSPYRGQDYGTNLDKDFGRNKSAPAP